MRNKLKGEINMISKILGEVKSPFTDELIHDLIENILLVGVMIIYFIMKSTN